MADSFVSKHSGKTIEEMMALVKNFFTTMKIAEVSIYRYMPFTVVIHVPPGYLADIMPNMAPSICRGFFPTLMSIVMNRPHEITSEEQYGPDGEYSKIVIEPVTR